MSRYHGNTETATSMAQSMAAGGVGFKDKHSEIRLDSLTMQLPYHSVYLFSLYPEVLEKRCGSAGVFRIPACESGQRISKPLVLSNVIRTPYVDALDGVLKTDDVSGEATAEDLMRPLMFGEKESVWSFGQNWEDFGAFWTKNEVPTDEEVEEARKKLEATYRRALIEATTLESTGQTHLVTPIMRHAATYFEEDRSWNRQFKKKLECPGCGESAKAGIIQHACGYIFDRERYEANFGKKPKQ